MIAGLYLVDRVLRHRQSAGNLERTQFVACKLVVWAVSAGGRLLCHRALECKSFGENLPSDYSSGTNPKRLKIELQPYLARRSAQPPCQSNQN